MRYVSLFSGIEAPELHIEIYELSDGRNIVNEVER